MNANFNFLWLFFLLFIGCSKSSSIDPTQSSESQITGNPTIVGIPSATASYDAVSFAYTLTVPANTDLKSLILTIPISAGASISPNPAVARDYSYPVAYVVTAANGSNKQKYYIQVAYQTGSKSSDKQITAFIFAGLNPIVSAQIDQTTHQITATVPTNTDLTKLVPTITVSAKAMLSPASGVAQNFTNAITYKITADDGSTQTYTVNVVKEGNTVPTGYGCLVTRIEAVESGDICTFEYDKLGHVVKVNIYNKVYPQTFVADLTCVYNGTTDELVTAISQSIKTTIGNKKFTFTYSGGKLTKINEYNAALNNDTQLTELKYSDLQSAYWHTFDYTSGVLIQEKDNIQNYGTGRVVGQWKPSDTKSIVYSQRRIPAFLYAFSAVMEDFDYYRLAGVVDKDPDCANPFRYLFGYNMPISGSPNIPGLGYTLKFVTNSNGFPTEMVASYKIDNIYRPTKEFTYKFTYSGCQ